MWSQSEEKGKVWCFSQDLKTDCAGKRKGVLGRGTRKGIPGKGIKCDKSETRWDLQVASTSETQGMWWFFHATEWALTPGERMREWAGSSQGFQRKKDKGWEKKCSSGLPLPAAAVCESNPHVLGTIWLQITKCLWNVSAFSRMCGVDSWKMGLERRQGQNYKPYQRAWPWCRPAVFFQFVVCWWLASKLPGVLLIKAGFKCPAQDLRKTHFQGVRHF